MSGREERVVPTLMAARATTARARRNETACRARQRNPCSASREGRCDHGELPRRVPGDARSAGSERHPRRAAPRPHPPEKPRLRRRARRMPGPAALEHQGPRPRLRYGRTAPAPTGLDGAPRSEHPRCRPGLHSVALPPRPQGEAPTTGRGRTSAGVTPAEAMCCALPATAAGRS